LKTPLAVDSLAELTVLADNLARVSVGSAVVIQNNRAIIPHRGNVILKAGACTNITVEYVEAGVFARIYLHWRYKPVASTSWTTTEAVIASNFFETTCPPSPPLAGNLTGTGYCATYYPNTQAIGGVVQRIEPTSNLDWGMGSPIPGVVDGWVYAFFQVPLVSPFLLSFSLSVELRACLKNPYASGTNTLVRLRFTTSDSVILYVNNGFVPTGIDHIAQFYVSASCAPIAITFRESRGTANLRIEWAYRPAELTSLPGTETQFALVETKYLVPDCRAIPVWDGTGLCGSYFNNINYDGVPTFTRIDPVVNFTWGAGSPFPARPNHDPASPADGAAFSVRFTGCLINPFTTGDALVKLVITANQGLRVFTGDSFVGGAPIPQTREFPPILIPSRSCWPIRMEYFENGASDSASVSVSWSYMPSGLQSQLYGPVRVIESQYWRPAACPAATIPPIASFANGTGLCGTYTPNENRAWVEDQSLKRIDSTVNFNWGAVGPLVPQPDRWRYVSFLSTCIISIHLQ
jgi:hypothetical protein